MGTAASHCYLTKSKNNKNPQQLTLRHPVVVCTSLSSIWLLLRGINLSKMEIKTLPWF